MGIGCVVWWIWSDSNQSFPNASAECTLHNRLVTECRAVKIVQNSGAVSLVTVCDSGHQESNLFVDPTHPERRILERAVEKRERAEGKELIGIF